jgi:hypothetical protein
MAFDLTRAATLAALGAALAGIAHGCGSTFGSGGASGGAGGGPGGAGGAGGTGGAGGGGAAGAAGSGGHAGSCADGGSCFVLPEGGWQGPVIVVSGPDVAPSCPSGWPKEEATGKIDPTGTEPATCGLCGCNIEGDFCANKDVPVDLWPQKDCMLGSPTKVLVDATCKEFTVLGSIAAVLAHPYPASGGVCKATAGVVSIPAPQFGRAVRLCGLDVTPAACGDGVCLPPLPPRADAVCIHAEGELDCPEGYGPRTVYDGFGADTRGCTKCECGDVTKKTDCNATIGLFGAAPCQASLGAVGTDGVCKNLVTTVPKVAMELNDATIKKSSVPGSCAAMGGEPTGAIPLLGPRTVCCHPVP